MKAMALKKITWSDLGEEYTKTHPTKTRYYDAIEHDLNVRDKILTLDASSLDVPYHIYFQPKGRRRTKIGGDSRTIKSITDLHLSNFVNKATAGLYQPNESWIVPRITELVDNTLGIDEGFAQTIMDHILLDPAMIMDAHKKSTGNVILERQLLKEEFGIIASYENFLDLIEVTFESDADFRQADGRSMNDREKADLRMSVDHLRAKYDVVRGIVRRNQGTSKVDEWGVQMAPHVAKIAFGGNLAMASMLVEGFMGSLHELVGRRNLGGAIRGIIMPLTGNLIKGKEERRVLARDLAHTIKAVTHGRYVDFEQPASSVEKLFLVNSAQWLGNHMLMPAKQVMSGIAGSRAISTRFFIQDNFHAIVKLAGLMGPRRLNPTTGKIEDNPNYKPFDPSDANADGLLKGYMHDAGIAKFNWTLTQYLVQSGLLSDLSLLLDDGSGRSPSLEGFMKLMDDRDYYSPTLLMEHTNRNDSWDSASNDYHNAHKIIGALRYIEKSFIEEVLVAPNAFDVATGTRKKGDSWSMGPFDVIWEVFQRYPMLFVSQHVVRKSTGWNPTALAMNLLGLLILDTLYMVLLRIAAGQPHEDIIEEWEESPFATSMKYGVRLPVLGRILGITAQGVHQAAGQFAIGGKGQFIAVSAGELIARDLVRGAGSLKNLVMGGDEESYGTDFLNVLKHVPYIGEAWGRGAFYIMADHVEAPDFAKPVTDWFTLRRGRGGGGGNRTHYGIPTPLTGFTYEGMLQQMGRELFPGLTHVSEAREPLPRMAGIQQPVAAPERAPETVRETKDPVASLMGESKYMQAPEGLTGN